VGKTDRAIELALSLDTEIISADSRQCYRELNIGVAKPSDQQLAQVKHYFVNTHSVRDDLNAAAFEKYALDAVEGIFSKKDIAVMVGGTGLYIKAFCEGLDAIPPISPALRDEIRRNYEREGLSWLQEQVKANDPGFFSVGETDNPQRLMRALEVKLHTGQSIISYRKHVKKERDFRIIKIGLELPKESLRNNIYQRTDEMMEKGLLDEVRSLTEYRHLNALQTVGYKELFSYLDGFITLEQAIQDIKQNTAQYAKRQLTWFRRDKDVQWFSPIEEGLLQQVISRLGSKV
jgi:tRNA dimethylallyltransferase